VSSYTFPGIFIAAEVDAVRDKRLGDTTMFDVQMLLEDF
jgi:hypothetical protein